MLESGLYENYRDPVLLKRYKYIIKYGTYNQIMLDLTPVIKPDGLLSHLAVDLITRAEIEIAYLQNNLDSRSIRDVRTGCYDSFLWEYDHEEDPHDLESETNLKGFFKEFMYWVLETLSKCSASSYTTNSEERLLAEKSESTYLYSTNSAIEFMLRCLKVPFLDKEFKEFVVSCIFSLANSLHESNTFGLYAFSCIDLVKQITTTVEELK